MRKEKKRSIVGLMYFVNVMGVRFLFIVTQQQKEISAAAEMVFTLLYCWWERGYGRAYGVHWSFLGIGGLCIDSGSLTNNTVN